MEREQFTFYASFARAIGRIRKAADRCAAYDAICSYALTGVLPDVDALPDSAAIAFEVAKPILDASKRKAENGRLGGSKREATASKAEANPSKAQANTEQGEIESKGKDKNKDKDKDKNKDKIKNKCYIPPVVPLAESEPADALVEAFNEFWSAYPKKVGKKEAQKAFAKVPKAEWPKLVPAVEAQKKSKQWQKDDGQYIPNPTTWLNQGRWEDSVEPNKSAYARMYDPPVKLGELDQLLEQI